MKAFCFSLTLLCVVQSILAIPRPDFGIGGVVPNYDKVVQAGEFVLTEFNKVGAKTVTLTSGYDLLTTLNAALTAIGDDFVRVGGDLVAKMKLLAEDDVGPINTVFGNVATQITNLETLITTGATANINTITGLLTRDIEDQFRDAFLVMSGTLQSLTSVLNTLKADVTKAKAAAGTAPTASPAIVKKNIPAKSVTDVVAQYRNLRTNIPLITYVVDSSLDNLKLADTFILDISAEAALVSGDYGISVAGFQTLLGDEALELSGIITATIGANVNTLLSAIQTDLDAKTGYTGTLQASLTSVDTQLTSATATISAISGYYQNYSDDVPDLITDLDADLGNSLCEPLRTVSEALVANAPYSDFCFSKYSPRVFALLALTINTFDMCFERELARLFNLHPITERFIVQIVYNVEDLADNLDVCLAITGPAADTCLTTIAPYYDTLATQIGAELALLARLVEKETMASYNRLGACLRNSVFVTVASGIDIIADIHSCMDTGPVV